MEQQYFLTIDNGGTNTKVVIFDQAGMQVAAQAFPTRGLEPHAGFHEIDLAQLYQDLGTNTKKALAEAGLTGDQISGVATVGHGKGLYTLDKNLKPLRNGILSADSRATELAEEFEGRVSEIFPISHQHVMPSQAPVILRWLKDNDPSWYQEIGAVLSNKDFIGYLLTNEVKQELGDASGNNFLNLPEKRYDQRLFDFFGIEEVFDCMPTLMRATEQRGIITPAAATVTGLAAGTPVFGGMFDIDACSIATGVLDDSMFSIIAGTWNMNIFPSETMASEETGLMNSIFPTGKWLVEASSPTSAGNLAIMLKMLMTSEIDNAKADGHSIYDDLEVFLQTTDARFSKVLFFPFLYGSNADPDAEGTFIGIRSNTTKSELIRAVYEGIAFAHRYHVDKLLAVRGQKPTVVRMSGGGTNSKQWVQIFANILGIPVELVSATELGGLGGAMASVVGLGVYPDLNAAVDQMVTVSARFEPQEEQVAIYDQKYQSYVTMLEALNGSWRQFKSMQERIDL